MAEEIGSQKLEAEMLGACRASWLPLVFGSLGSFLEGNLDWCLGRSSKPFGGPLGRWCVRFALSSATHVRRAGCCCRNHFHAGWDGTEKPDDVIPFAIVRGPMLRALLGERFHLKVRRETREGPVYELTAAKGGAKTPPWARAETRTIERARYRFL